MQNKHIWKLSRIQNAMIIKSYNIHTTHTYIYLLNYHTIMIIEELSQKEYNRLKFSTQIISHRISSNKMKRMSHSIYNIIIVINTNRMGRLSKEAKLLCY